MHQRELLEETIDFLTPKDKKQRGIRLHEKYSQVLKILMVILFVVTVIHWYFTDLYYTMFFGIVLLGVGIFSEILFRRTYGFTGQDAVKYYALKLYDEPSEEDLHQLHTWNKNPFDISTEYYYPRIGYLVEDAKETENPEEYVHKRIPDELRLIERRENESYQALVDLELKDLNLDPYYEDLIREVNYCYKFGAYTSVSVLLRKIAEQLMVDILTSKGLYTELSTEYGFEELANVFINEVVAKTFPEGMTENVSTSLNTWIRKKGNKGAHKGEDFTKEEMQELMDHARKVIRILIVIRAEVHPEYEPTDKSFEELQD